MKSECEVKRKKKKKQGLRIKRSGLKSCHTFLTKKEKEKKEEVMSLVKEHGKEKN